MSQNNPLSEIGAIIVSVAIIAGATTMVILGKINYIEASEAYLLAVGIYGGHLALKAPSPSQQSQLIAQHQSLQDMMSQVLSALPALFQQASTPPPVVVNNQIPPAQPAAAQPIPPMPVQPQVAQVPFADAQAFKAGNTFAPPVMPQ